jgi:murein endopeptidase
VIPFRRLALLLPVVVAALTAAALALPSASEEQPPRPAPGPPPTVEAEPPPPPLLPSPEPEPRPQIRWRRSAAVGDPAAGRLIRGVRLPVESEHHFTWDPVKRRSPNRWWRRYGTDRLVRMVLSVVREYAAAHPGAPRLGIGDLSRPRGGDFGPQFGYIGHASHQNGLDVDVYYPRADGRERAPRYASQIERALSQDLVDRFIAKGASTIFVGPSTGLTGPSGRVVPLINHDNHLHVRIP